MGVFVYCIAGKKKYIVILYQKQTAQIGIRQEKNK